MACDQKMITWGSKRARSSNDIAATSTKLKKTEYGELRKKTFPCKFVGKPVPQKQAQEKWPSRYDYESYENKTKNQRKQVLLAKCHYTKAEVKGCMFCLYDDVYVEAVEDGKPPYIAKIIEFFESTEDEQYFIAQWFYRPIETVIKEDAMEELGNSFDKKLVFYTDIKDANPLKCLISKLKIERIAIDVDSTKIPDCDYYYNMSYSPNYSTFSTMAGEQPISSLSISSKTCSSGAFNGTNDKSEKSSSVKCTKKPELKLLDLYSGCGAMSTGLCLGAAIAGVNLVTRWSVDFNKNACETVQHNHPETKVRCEAAQNFLCLLKIWKKLCEKYSLIGPDSNEDEEDKDECYDSLREWENLCEKSPSLETDSDDVEESKHDSIKSSKSFDVEKMLDICFGIPDGYKNPGVYFKVRWEGYDSSYDSWEPIGGLSECPDRVREFVTNGHRTNIFPLPGNVDVICGGPPCQGMSGFNRFRNSKDPLQNSQNNQVLVFMTIVEFLKPKYVLMENVVDIVKFSRGFLGRYTIGRLAAMKYQVRLGLLAAGCYGVPQFRMRAFFWGAQPSKKLPPFPLPTHEVVVRGCTPLQFKRNLVAHIDGDCCKLRQALYLKDVISDLPEVQNNETQDKIMYERAEAPEKFMLYDHRPLKLSRNDYERVTKIPKKKGANFRDLPGLKVGEGNIVALDPDVKPRPTVSSKLAPLVPDYALSFQEGKSLKPFGRLWWDETVSTVVTRAEPHNQIILHPSQDRVLTIRENARIQGFPDYYRLMGNVKERYKQVGNAVAVPVAQALGYALGLAYRGISIDEPLITLPQEFPEHLWFATR